MTTSSEHTSHAPTMAVNLPQVQGVRVRVLHVRYTNGDFHVLNVEHVSGSDPNGPHLRKGMTFGVKGTFDSLGVGAVAELHGVKWDQNYRYGLTACPETLVELYDEDTQAVEVFLRDLPQIGASRAKDIVRHYGSTNATLRAFLDSPHEVATTLTQNINGITADRATEIMTAFKQKAEKAELIRFLLQIDVAPAMIGKITKKLGSSQDADSFSKSKDVGDEDGGEDAHKTRTLLEQLKRNPYVLALKGDLSFQICDHVAQKLRPYQSDEDAQETTRCRWMAAAVLWVLAACREEGHTLLDARSLERNSRALKDALGTSIDTKDREVVLTAGVEQAVEQNYLWRQQLTGSSRVFLAPMKLVHAEKDIARFLWDAMNSPAPNLEPLPDEAIASLSEEQQEAVQLLQTNRVLVLTGGPGVGKTHTVKKLIELLEHNNIFVTCLAPTGVAAKRITEATGREASTIHRFVGRRKAKSMDDSTSATGAFIIDEMSMVSTELLAWLFASLNPELENFFLVLVGDVDQLPSIDPGAVLRDLLDSRSLPAVRLTKIFRQAEESAIPWLAKAINNAEPLVLGKGVVFIDAPSDVAAAQIITHMVTERLAELPNIDVRRDIQVLSPQNTKACGVQTLNVDLQNLLNPTADSDRIWVGNGYKVATGDRVINTTNNYKTNVFNGEQGHVLAANWQGIHRSTFEQLSMPMPVDIDRNSQRSRGTVMIVDLGDRKVAIEKNDLSAWQLSYAMTVHRSQGSQYPIVVMPIVDEHSFMLQRALVYTGVTRAQKLIVLVGSQERLIAASASTRGSMRRTGLVATISEVPLQDIDIDLGS